MLFFFLCRSAKVSASGALPQIRFTHTHTCLKTAQQLRRRRRDVTEFFSFMSLSARNNEQNTSKQELRMPATFSALAPPPAVSQPLASAAAAAAASTGGGGGGANDVVHDSIAQRPSPQPPRRPLPPSVIRKPIPLPCSESPLPGWNTNHGGWDTAAAAAAVVAVLSQVGAQSFGKTTKKRNMRGGGGGIVAEQRRSSADAGPGLQQISFSVSGDSARKRVPV